MAQPLAAEAFEAGMKFMTWIFSDYTAFKNELSKFFSELNVNLQEVHNRYENEELEQVLSWLEGEMLSKGKGFFAWFEVGRNTIFMSNLAGTGAPTSLVNVAIPGYRAYLGDVGFTMEERDFIESQLRQLSNASLTQKEATLGKMIERIKHQAFVYQEREKMGQGKVINISSGAIITAPVTIADTIQDSFNVVKESKVGEDIKVALNELLKAVTEASKSAPPELAQSMARDAEALSKEVTSANPRRKWYELSIEGLKEAATSLEEIGVPILNIMQRLLPLISPS